MEAIGLPTQPFRTMIEIEDAFLGYSPSRGESFGTKGAERAKANYNIDGSGFVNVLYTEYAYRQILLSETLQGSISKGAWMSGRRYFKSAFSTTATDAALALGGAPKTAAVGTYYETDFIPKLATHTVDITDTYKMLAAYDNNVQPTQLIDDGFNTWRNLIDRQMHADYDVATTTTSIESLMRLLATPTTTTNLSYTDDDDNYPLNDPVDKDAETWALPYNNVPSSAQNFSLDLIDTAVVNCNPYWKQLEGSRAGAFIITGESGYKKIKQHVGPEIWQQKSANQFTVDGVITEQGTEFTRAIAAYDQMPIIQDSLMWATGTTSDIVLLHRKALELDILLPPIVMQSEDVIKNNAFVGRTVFEAQMELQAIVYKALGWIGKIA